MFRWVMALVLGVVLTHAAVRAEEPTTAPAAPAVDRAPTMLEGTWKLVSAEFLGEKMPAEETEGKRIVFRGNEMFMLDKGEELAADSDKATFKLDVNANPKGITMTDPEDGAQSWNGIFTVEGDQLTLVMAPPGGERPKAMDAAGTMKMVLKKS